MEMDSNTMIAIAVMSAARDKPLQLISESSIPNAAKTVAMTEKITFFMIDYFSCLTCFGGRTRTCMIVVLPI